MNNSVLIQARFRATRSHYYFGKKALALSSPNRLFDLLRFQVKINPTCRFYFYSADYIKSNRRLTMADFFSHKISKNQFLCRLLDYLAQLPHASRGLSPPLAGSVPRDTPRDKQHPCSVNKSMLRISDFQQVVAGLANTETTELPLQSQLRHRK